MKPDLHYGFYTGTGIACPSFIAAVKGYGKGVPLTFTVERTTDKKSAKQNSYLHVLFDIVARTLNSEGMGDGNPYTKDRVKALCKAEGLYPVMDVVKPGGEVVQIPKETRDLTREEAAQTIDNVIRYWAECGIVLPPPGQQTEIDIAA